VIVFVIGGISKPELRHLYELMYERNQEVVCGGTSLITPATYLEQVFLRFFFHHYVVEKDE